MTDPSNPRLRIKRDHVAALAVALAPLCFFFSAVRGSVILSPDDAKTFNTPLRVAAANIVRHGFLPLWDPYVFSGMPLHGAAQAGLLFPVNWFFLIASPPVAVNLMMLATYMLAALGAYLFARRAGADIAGAIVTSLVWQSSAFLLEHIGHTNILHTAAMLPWVLWATEGYVATGSRRRGVLLALVIALQAFAGHQQMLLYSIILTVVYGLAIARASRAPRKIYLQLSLFIVAGLVLSAAQILPTFELLRNSIRATTTYDFFGTFSMPPQFASTLLAPYGRGGGNGILFRAPYTGPQFFGEYSAYVGLLTLMLAGVALLLKRNARNIFWGVVFVAALFLAFGRFEPFQFYQLLYHVPVLNLFRCPGRHLMEAQFAIAVLAGRGLTAMRSNRGRSALRAALIAGATVFLLTWLAVTWWRPAEFQLDRNIPVTLLRAPELFVPVLIATLSAVVLFMFARSRSRRALLALFVVLVLDLAIYSQGSGWVTHALPPDFELWQVPGPVKFLREKDPAGEGAYRILTQDQSFDPAVAVEPRAPDSGETFLLQPDIYMMHGVENAAGYDGFGMARYSRLAGDMKVWGELTDPDRTLRSDSRELDLLNVKYLLTRPAITGAVSTFPRPTQQYGNEKFAEVDLGLAPLTSGQQLAFKVPPTEVDRIALLTNLAWSNEIPDHVAVARIQLRSEDGKIFDFDLRTGDHTSEWAHDRADIHAQIKHQRAPVATSDPVEDVHGKYEAHTYISVFNLPARTRIASGVVNVLPVSNAPQLSMSITRISLTNGAQAFPLRRDWVTVAAASSAAKTRAQSVSATDRWKKIAEMKDVVVFENNRSLPRTWLTAELRRLDEGDMLQVIRTGKFSNGEIWDPLRVALIESSTDFKAGSFDEARTAQLTTHEPNRVIVRAKSTSASILVLSENEYPGWRTYVDGRFVDTLRVDYNLRGVILPAGDHTIEFLYRPKSVLVGVAISLLTLLGLLVWANTGRRDSKT
jgi:Bacterial membrane protein YfhO